MSTYACAILPDYVNDGCGGSETARVRSIAFVKRTSTITDPSSVSQWQALESSKNARIIREIRGSYDGGVAVESAGFGAVPVRIQNMNHTLTVTDPTPTENNDFWNEMKRQASDYELWLLTENHVLRTYGVPSVAPSTPITDDISQEIYMVVTIKWQYEDTPKWYAKPSTYLDIVPA